MLFFYKILFFNTLIMGSLIAISAYSWFNMWIGLEINLLSMIPLMKSNFNMYPAESTLKYFITQSLASTFILLAIIMSYNTQEIFSNNNIYLMIMNSALLTKLGAAPFHAWFPEVIEGLNWLNSLLMLTWQKIAPMILIMYNLKMTVFLSFIIMISVVIGGVMGINQISLRKILAYSSINHIAWMLAGMLFMSNIWMSYFIIYMMISINIIYIFYILNTFTLNQLFSKINSNKIIKMFFIFNFMSLGGLPPFLGFLPKWLVINNLINNNFYFISLLLILFTLITLYFYIRISLSTFSLAYQEVTLNNEYISNFFMMYTNLFILSSLFMCTSLFNFL
uniref:NADH-ubiquinone oxidoreductase chain 2 n=1 Tax=Gastrolina thoracica TaxID=2041218 RepID=A0A343KIE1_9CUCU|nr:NADH dehydrogenase subunit 2 [Gastrolina thoracica]ATG33619.1 NADH dehydrogenase subunit 2 [Gastrolina thoracica]